MALPVPSFPAALNECTEIGRGGGPTTTPVWNCGFSNTTRPSEMETRTNAGGGGKRIAVDGKRDTLIEKEHF